jgi:hypothetical protein
MIFVARVESRNIDTTHCKCNPNNLISATSFASGKHETYPVVPQRFIAIHAIERYHPQAVDDELVRKYRGVHFDFHDVDGWITSHIEFKTRSENSGIAAIGERSSN